MGKLIDILVKKSNMQDIGRQFKKPFQQTCGVFRSFT